MIPKPYFSAIVAVLALVACSKDFQEQGPQHVDPISSDNVHTLSVGIEAGTYTPAEGGTKASMEAVIRVNWTKDDEVSVVNATTGKILGGCLKAKEAGVSVTFEGTVTGTINENDVLYYIYPRVAQNDSEVDFENDGYGVSLAGQTYDGNNPGKVCFYGYAEDTFSDSSTTTSTLISKKIQFTLVTSYAHLNMANLPATGCNLSSIDISKVNKGFKWSLSDSKELTADAYGENEGISVNCSNCKITQAGNAVVRFAIPASTATGSDSRVVTVNKAYTNDKYVKDQLISSAYYNQLYTSWTNNNVNVNSTAGDKTEVTIDNLGSTETAEGILPVASSGESAFAADKPTEISLGGLGTITFNKEASAAIKTNAGESTSVFFKVEDVTQTKPAQNANLVYEFTMKTLDNNGTEVFSKNNAGAESEATVVIELGQAVQSVESVSLVDENGNPITGDAVKNVNFDQQTGKLTFTVIHFSKYAIKYTTKAEPESGYVAQIGGRKYETLASAIAAATASQTIEVLSDITLDSYIEIKKPGITIDGNDKTIAVSDDEYWNQYKVGESNSGLGKCNMISVSADNFTLKNVTLDGKECRGVSLCTTTGGKNVLYQNVTYKGRGSGHYYGEATGLVTFDGCKFDIHGYAIHFGGESSLDDDVVIKNCEVNGWSSFGACKSLTISGSHFYGANDEGKNGWLAVLRPYCPTTITNCTFSDIYLHEAVSGYECIGLGTGAATTVILNGCKVVDDNKHEKTGVDIYSIVRENGFDNETAQNGSVFAFDAEGNATDGFKSGIFYAETPGNIELQSGHEYYAIEGKTNIYGVREKAITTQAEFETACAAAKSGDKIVLDNGNFAITSSTVGNKELAFKGQGENTIIRIGNPDGDGNQGTGTCNYSPKLSFESLSLTTLDGKEDTNYTGFTSEGELYFKNVKFLTGFSNWGNQGKNVTFVDCTFNQHKNDRYCVQELRSGNGTEFLFDNCKFICTGEGRFVNAYKQGGENASIKISVKGCTFDGNASTQSKAAVNLKSGYSDGCNITLYLLGNNTTNNVANGTKTGSPLFDDNSTNATVYQGTDENSASIIWQNGAKVE